MEKVKEGDTVRIAYSMKLNDGTVIDSSELKGPRQFTVGKGEVFPALERELIGMAPGDSKTLYVPAAEAYGPRDEGRVFQFHRSRAAENFDPEIGQRIQMSRADGVRISVTVIAKTDESFAMDANHPLAGKDLVFEITLIEVL